MSEDAQSLDPQTENNANFLEIVEEYFAPAKQPVRAKIDEDKAFLRLYVTNTLQTSKYDLC